MKKVLYIFLLAATIVGCDDRLQELNTDKNNPATVGAETLFARATREIVDNMTSISVNDNPFRLYAQAWAQTTYPEESQFNVAGREIPYNFYVNQYRDVLVDLNDAKMTVQAQIDDPNNPIAEEILENQIAVIDILMGYTFSTLVDAFGDVPYSEALQLSDDQFPVYEDAATIYNSIVGDLTSAVETLTTAANASAGLGVFTSTESDLVYGGSVASWARFGNSHKLRMAMRIADVNGSQSVTWANEAMTAGVFTSNADNFSMVYQGAAPNSSPMHEDLVLSGRSDFCAANTLVDYMNGVNDPRRMVYYRQNLGAGVYQGGTYGTGNSYSGSTQIGDVFHQASTPGVLMSYAEVAFLMAEMAERNASGSSYNVTGTAESYYDMGVTASIAEWQSTYNMYMGASVSLDAATYLAETEVDYATATGTWREKIGKQLWIAQFNQGFEAWTTYRRFDFGLLTSVTVAGETLDVPRRWPYPIREQNLNPTNYAAAVAKITGGDEMTSRIFWDNM